MERSAAPLAPSPSAATFQNSPIASGVAGSTGVSQPTAHAGRHQVVVQSPVNRFDPATLANIQNEIQQYLGHSPDVFHSASLHVTVTAIGEGTTTPGISFDINGQLNGAAFRFSTSDSMDREYLQDEGGFFAGGVLGVAANQMANSVTGINRRKMAGGELRILMNNCMSNILSELGRAGGQKESSSSSIYGMINLGLAVLYCFIAVVFLVVHIFTSGLPETGVGVLFALFGTLTVPLPFVLLIHTVRLACMPTAFYLRDPLGRSAMAWSGVKDVQQMRVVALAIAGVLTFGLLYFLKIGLFGF